MTIHDEGVRAFVKRASAFYDRSCGKLGSNLRGYDAARANSSGIA